MAYDYDVQFVPWQEIGQADATSRLRLKGDGNDLSATVSATFEEAVNNINLLQKAMANDLFNKRIFKKFISKYGLSVWKWKKIAKKSKALRFQNDLIY